MKHVWAAILHRNVVKFFYQTQRKSTPSFKAKINWELSFNYSKSCVYPYAQLVKITPVDFTGYRSQTIVGVVHIMYPWTLNINVSYFHWRSWSVFPCPKPMLPIFPVITSFVQNKLSITTRKTTRRTNKHTVIFIL